MRAVILMVGLLLSTVLLLGATTSSTTGAKPEWSMNATAIEACSCPVFCQCYFNTSPAAPGGSMGNMEHMEHSGNGEEHFCRFNNAYKVNKGYFGATSLDGAKFWIYGDLGGDFTKGMNWAVVTFDRSTSQAQREAIGKIAAHLFPVHWKSLTTAEGDITWTASKTEANATLDGGKSAEVALKMFKGMKGEPVVIKNLPYWGAPQNDGFVIMPNTVEALRTGDKQFEFHGSNGFMITFNLDAKTAPPAASGM